MQKNMKFRLKKLRTRIIPFVCFIFALAISPLAFKNAESSRTPATKDDFSAILSENILTENSKSYADKAGEDENAEDSAVNAELSQNHENAEMEQSEVETISPKLSESYMLRELFSEVDFSVGSNADDKDYVDTSSNSNVISDIGKGGEKNPQKNNDSLLTEKKENPNPEKDTFSNNSADNEKINISQTQTNIDADNVEPSENVEVKTNETIEKADEVAEENNNSESVSAGTFSSNSSIAVPEAYNGSGTRGSITTVRVLDHNSGAVSLMELDEYIAGVIVSEMPSYAGNEALKAQAVACRTFVVNRAVVSSTHSGADVCTNPGHCQAFTSKAKFSSKYGESGNEYYNRAYAAAKATSGIIAVYNGAPITAAFHASSGGSTMSSADVWGGSLPYLVPVYSPEQDDPEMRELISAHKSFSKESFIRYLAANGYSAASAYYDADFEDFVGQITHTNSGKVANVSIAGENISGQTMKNIFSLRSTCFSISYDEKNITFECLGYGHGVGMSQLGACTMAKQGATYAEILTHYYTGVELTIW